MSAAAATWRLAFHESRLAWRDIVAMTTGNKPARARVVVIVVAALAVALHAIAYSVIGTAGDSSRYSSDLLFVSACLVLPVALMTSQAMESVTRLFYSRSDLDLMLASPTPVRRIFATRLATIALTTSATALLLGSPAIHVLAATDDPGWLAVYPLFGAMALIGTVLALWLTLGLFRLIGARRTRVIAQVLAALVGASFVIGVQLAAIASMGSASRVAFLTSEPVRDLLPAADSLFWYPARAATGELVPLLALIGLAALVFAATAILFAERFSAAVLAAAGVASAARPHQARRRFRRRSTAAALRNKEWKLLLRDPWLLSQTLMQLFYLLPPGFMLWQGFGGEGLATAIATPVIVMAAGQLAGGLAWLAISGEDAPQLVATAPVTSAAVLTAKVEAVLGAVFVLSAPILIGMALADVAAAFVCAFGIAAAAISAIMIQMWFRSQSRRSNFRRRQTSSRIATFAEAFSSIFWAGAAGLLATGSTYSLVLVIGALAVLASVRAIAPRQVEFAG